MQHHMQRPIAIHLLTFRRETDGLWFLYVPISFQSWSLNSNETGELTQNLTETLCYRQESSMTSTEPSWNVRTTRNQTKGKISWGNWGSWNMSCNMIVNWCNIPYLPFAFPLSFLLISLVWNHISNGLYIAVPLKMTGNQTSRNITSHWNH